jgi:hypothetical protein
MTANEHMRAGSFAPHAAEQGWQVSHGAGDRGDVGLRFTIASHVTELAEEILNHQSHRLCAE